MMTADEITAEVHNNLSLIASDKVTVGLGESIKIPVSIANVFERMDFEARSKFEEIASTEHTFLNGIEIMGNLHGNTQITLEIPETGVRKNIVVMVGKGSKAVEIPTTVILPQSVYRLEMGKSIEIVPEVYPDDSEEGEWTLTDNEQMISVKGNTFFAEQEGEVTARYTLFNHPDIYVECRIVVQKEKNYSTGDVNEDGKTNIADLRIVLRSVCGKVQLSTRQVKIVDVDGEDGKVDIRDLRKILRFICSKVAEL